MHRGGFSLLTNYRMRRSVAISLRYYGFFGELRFGDRGAALDWAALRADDKSPAYDNVILGLIPAAGAERFW